jgi:hypothetical protein
MRHRRSVPVRLERETSSILCDLSKIAVRLTLRLAVTIASVRARGASQLLVFCFCKRERCHANHQGKLPIDRFHAAGLIYDRITAAGEPGVSMSAWVLQRWRLVRARIAKASIAGQHVRLAFRKGAISTVPIDGIFTNRDYRTPRSLGGLCVW